MTEIIAGFSVQSKPENERKRYAILAELTSEQTRKLAEMSLKILAQQYVRTSLRENNELPKAISFGGEEVKVGIYDVVDMEVFRNDNNS